MPVPVPSSVRGPGPRSRSGQRPGDVLAVRSPPGALWLSSPPTPPEGGAPRRPRGQTQELALKWLRNAALVPLVGVSLHLLRFYFLSLHHSC